MKHMTRRLPNTGSYYRRTSDGMYCAAFTVTTSPRRRRVFVAADPDDLRAKVRRAVESGVLRPLPYQPPTTRAQKVAAGRALATHDEADLRRVARAAGGVCHYCDTRLNVFNAVTDHKIPLCRGGSDGADNLDYICWQCNLEKARRTPAEWGCYTGPRPRPFAPLPLRAAEWRAFAGAR